MESVRRRQINGDHVCWSKLHKYDQFGQSFALRIGQDGMDSLPSKVGTICSLALTVILLFYTVYKSIILEGRKSIDFVQAIKENHFDDSHVFGA